MTRRSFSTEQGFDLRVRKTVNDMLLYAAFEEVYDLAVTKYDADPDHVRSSLSQFNHAGEDLPLVLDEGVMQYIEATLKIEGVINGRLVGRVFSNSKVVSDVYDHWLAKEIVEDEAVLSMVEDGPYDNVASLEVTRGGDVIVWIRSGPTDTLNSSHEQEVAELS